MSTTLGTRTTAIPQATSQPLVMVGRTLVAFGLIGIGVTHFVFGDFMLGRAPPWPDGVPGKGLWTGASGTSVILAGIAILMGRRVRAVALFIAALIAVWALARNLPVLFIDAPFAGSWTRLGKAWTLLGGALAVAATAPPIERGNAGMRRLIDATDGFTTAARVLLGLFLLLTGVQHFLHTPFVASLIPAWFPGDAVSWTYVAGVALIVFGAGLLAPATAPLSALLAGCMVFSWFWIVHLPRTLVSMSDGVAIFEALAVSGIGFLLAGSLRQSSPAATTTPE